MHRQVEVICWNLDWKYVQGGDHAWRRHQCGWKLLLWALTFHRHLHLYGRSYIEWHEKKNSGGQQQCCWEPRAKTCLEMRPAAMEVCAVEEAVRREGSGLLQHGPKTFTDFRGLQASSSWGSGEDCQGSVKRKHNLLLQRAVVAEKGSHSASEAALQHHVKHTALSSPSWQRKCPPKRVSSTKSSQKIVLIVCIQISNYT